MAKSINFPHIALLLLVFSARRPCRVLKLNITAKFHLSGNLENDQSPCAIVGYEGNGLHIRIRFFEEIVQMGGSER